MLRSEITPILIAHILCGVLGILAGIVALSARKGSTPHRIAGTVFALVMVTGGATAAYLGYNAKPQDMGDVVAGAITIYFASTAYAAARQKDHAIGWFEPAAFVVPALGGVAALIDTSNQVASGVALLGGIPGYTFAAVAIFAALLDLSVILRRGLPLRQRIARHLWRMLIAFFIAAGSFFPGQLHLFPEFIREIKPIIILFLPAFSIIALMIYWLIRVLATRYVDAPKT